MEKTYFNAELVLVTLQEDKNLLVTNDSSDPLLESLPNSEDFDFELPNFSGEKVVNMFKSGPLTQEEVKERLHNLVASWK